jgi:hypothetical protein
LFLHRLTQSKQTGSHNAAAAALLPPQHYQYLVKMTASSFTVRVSTTLGAFAKLRKMINNSVMAACLSVHSR